MRPFSVTRRFFVYLAVLVLSALPAQYINDIYGYLPPLFLLIFAGVGIIYLLIIKRSLSCSISVDKKSCRRAETAVFNVKITNRSPLVLIRGTAEFFTEDSSGRDLSSAVMTFVSGAEMEQEFSFTAEFAHIGIYKAGIKSFLLYDPLGIFCMKAAGEENAFVVSVLPKTKEIAELPLSDENRAETARSAAPAARDGIDYSGVRNYSAGDPIRQIHWKLSAHMVGYMTKVMETYTDTGISVLFDFTCPDYGDGRVLCVLDCIVESGLSAARYAQKNGVDCDLIFFDELGARRRLIPAAESTGESLIAALPGMRTDGGGKGAELVKKEGQAAYGQTNLFICTGFLNREMVQAILEAKRNGKHPCVFLAAGPKGGETDKKSRGKADESESGKDGDGKTGRKSGRITDRGAENPFAQELRMLSSAGVPFRILEDVEDVG